MSRQPRRGILALTLSTIVAGAQPASPKPESLGFSTARLRWLHQAMQREVDQQRFAGVTTLLLRHGKVVENQSYGVKDIASGAPMTSDTIFRIYSMTKPVTGVAMMILYEEGKWLPSDPIAKFIPEFWLWRWGLGPMEVCSSTEMDAQVPRVWERETTDLSKQTTISLGKRPGLRLST